jgi:hypothetical protein
VNDDEENDEYDEFVGDEDVDENCKQKLW